MEVSSSCVSYHDVLFWWPADGEQILNFAASHDVLPCPQGSGSAVKGRPVQIQRLGDHLRHWRIPLHGATEVFCWCPFSHELESELPDLIMYRSYDGKDVDNNDPDSTPLQWSDETRSRIRELHGIGIIRSADIACRSALMYKSLLSFGNSMTSWTGFHHLSINPLSICLPFFCFDLANRANLARAKVYRPLSGKGTVHLCLRTRSAILPSAIARSSPALCHLPAKTKQSILRHHGVRTS